VTVISPATGELLAQVVEPAPPVACCAPTPGIDAGAIVGAALQPKPGSVKAIALTEGVHTPEGSRAHPPPLAVHG
jgi:hypothetical protein